MPTVVGASSNRRSISQIKKRKIAKTKRKPKKRCYKIRDKNLKELGFSSYSHYLRSGLWEKVRELAFAKHGGWCWECRKPATQLHHSSYDLSTLVGATLDHVYPVCRSCHEAAEFDENKKANLRRANEKLGIKTPKFVCPRCSQEKKKFHAELCRECFIKMKNGRKRKKHKGSTCRGSSQRQGRQGVPSRKKTSEPEAGVPRSAE